MRITETKLPEVQSAALAQARQTMPVQIGQWVMPALDGGKKSAFGASVYPATREAEPLGASFTEKDAIDGRKPSVGNRPTEAPVRREAGFPARWRSEMARGEFRLATGSGAVAAAIVAQGLGAATPPVAKPGASVGALPRPAEDLRPERSKTDGVSDSTHAAPPLELVLFTEPPSSGPAPVHAKDPHTNEKLVEAVAGFSEALQPADQRPLPRSVERDGFGVPRGVRPAREIRSDQPLVSERSMPEPEAAEANRRREGKAGVPEHAPAPGARPAAGKPDNVLHRPSEYSGTELRSPGRPENSGNDSYSRSGSTMLLEAAALEPAAAKAGNDNDFAATPPADRRRGDEVPVETRPERGRTQRPVGRHVQSAGAERPEPVRQEPVGLKLVATPVETDRSNAHARLDRAAMAFHDESLQTRENELRQVREAPASGSDPLEVSEKFGREPATNTKPVAPLNENVLAAETGRGSDRNTQSLQGSIAETANVSPLVAGETTHSSAYPPAQAGSPAFPLAAGSRHTPPSQQVFAPNMAMHEVIVEAARHLDQRPVEIRLHPAELGHLRLSLHVSPDNSLTFNVTAERHEALAFARRQVDSMIGQLQDAGYSNVTFSFSQDSRAFHRQQSPDVPDERLEQVSAALEGESVRALAARIVSLRDPSGVDLRL